MVSAARLCDPAIARQIAPRVSRDGDRAVIWLDGEQDIATASLLTDALARTIVADGASVMVDLSEVTFIDAAMIGVMMWGRNLLRLQSRSLTVRAPSRCASRLLEICGLAGLVEQDSPIGSPSTLLSSSLAGMDS